MVRAQAQQTKATKPADDGMVDADTATSAADLTEQARQIFDGEISAVGGLYTDSSGNPMGLHARIARIKGDLPDIDPEGTNKHFNYKFFSNLQIMGIFRPRLARQMIVVIPETVEENEPKELKTSKGGSSLLTRIKVTWRVVDALNGESFTGQSLGYGDDSGDKGANKAYTAALKNFLMKLFEVGGDADDLEEDEEADKRAKAREAGSERVRSVEIGDAEITGVKRGGRSEKATDAQVARVGQYIRDLELTPKAFATFADNVLGDALELSEDHPWDDVKAYLEDLSGKDIGKLVARFDAVMNRAAEDEARDEEARGDADLDENRE